MRHRSSKVRRLVLSRETVRSLEAGELQRVVGGESALGEKCVTTDTDNDASCGPSYCWDCTVRGANSNLRTC